MADDKPAINPADYLDGNTPAGTPIELAAGSVWLLPEPVVSWQPAITTNPDGSISCTGFGSDFGAYACEALEAARQQWIRNLAAFEEQETETIEYPFNQLLELLFLMLKQNYPKLTPEVFVTITTLPEPVWAQLAPELVNVICCISKKNGTETIGSESAC